MKSSYTTGVAILHHAPSCRWHFVFANSTQMALPELFDKPEAAAVKNVTKTNCDCNGKEAPVTCYVEAIDTQWWAFICPRCGVITRHLGPFFAAITKQGKP